MESPSEEHKNLTEDTVQSFHESYQNISNDNTEKLEERQAETCENEITDTDKTLDHNVRYQQIDINSLNLAKEDQNKETNLQVDICKSKEEMLKSDSHLNQELAENNGKVASDKYSEVVTGNILTENAEVLIEPYHEYVSLSENSQNVPSRAEEAQPTEYNSEYMLEHQTENVYMPEQVQEQLNLNQSEQVYSTEIISDDSQDNTSEQHLENLNHTTTEEGTETSDNFVSEYEVEQHGENRNVSSLEQTVISEPNDNCSLSENKEKPIKIEYTNSNIENVSDLASNTENCETVTRSEFESSTENYDNISEIENQSADDTVCKEPLSHDHFNVDVPTSKNEASGNKTSVGHDVKQEISSIVTNINLLKDKQPETENVSLPIEQEHISGSNTEIIENVETANLQPPATENILIEDYTVSEVTEIQEGEYTIVEGPSSLEISANQHSEDSNSDGTLVLLHNYENLGDNNIMTLTDEQHEAYLSELRSQTESRQSTSSQSSESKPRRGRKPTQEIPMHVLGHDISKPVDNTIPNGRALPKPRLGVKVPYRNLTSQIVTKAEIENEIMERARLKQEQANSRGDVVFARKLTQRLARKIAPSPDRPKKLTDASRSKEPVIQNQSKVSENKIVEGTETANERNDSATTTKDDSKIHNDSDLLAILEGEGEEMPVLPKETSQPEIEETNLKLLEREIALQQLQELPHQIPKQRIFKGRQVRSESKAPTLTAEVLILSKNKTVEKTNPFANETLVLSDNSVSKENTNQPVCAVSDKENSTTKQPISTEGGPSISPKREQSSADSPKKQPIEIEPQVKVNMVLKTYSRKRKTVELAESLAESPAPKKTILSETEIKTEKLDPSIQPDVYVTKSSRVIKKKVIWDPDEIPSRSPKTTARPDMQSPKVTAVKIVKPTDKNSNVEKVTDKKPSTERAVKEKLLEKKIVDKPAPKKISNEKVALSVDKKVPLPRTESPKNKTPTKNKKSRSEVDRLLMDEGAVKMLYELKNTDTVKKKKDVYSVERAHKEIIKKANEIKSDLEQNTSNESPKSLRKKEGNFTPSPIKQIQVAGSTERKMSKDSIRSSLHTPPGSPAYSFSHSQSSMLVRRRSSSSISSDDDTDTTDGSKPSRKKSNSTISDIPKPKRSKKESKEVAQSEGTKKEVLSKPAKPISTENKIMQYKSFSVKKTNKHVTINLTYMNEKCYCTVQVLEELTLVLKKISKDKDCNVVSITSNNKAFCLGLDYGSLVSEKEDVRKQNATELAGRVRDFLLCLLHFPKVLVAGIQGDCVGLGVTMLPLFDMVIASDGATFSTPYASLGCIPEAGFLLSSPNLSNHGLAAELFFTTQKLTADDVFRRGLISRLCWPEKYNETLKNTLMLISKASKQSLEATKKQLRKHIVQTTEAAINNEAELLIEHWISPECQKNFARINENSN